MKKKIIAMGLTFCMLVGIMGNDTLIAKAEALDLQKNEIVDSNQELLASSQVKCKYTLTGNVNNYSCKMTPVQMHGSLSVKGTDIVNEKGEKVQLRGVSLHGIQHTNGSDTAFKDYVNMQSFQILRDEWGVNLIRIPVYTAEGGYCQGNAASMDQTIKQAVYYATKLGMYVMIDWHILSDGNPQTYENEAISFFNKYGKKYASNKNVIYEICNEPNGVSWTPVRDYAIKVIKSLRKVNKNALIVVGTPDWSQLPNYSYDYDASKRPILNSDIGGSGSALAKNVLYSIHFYSASHYGDIQSNVENAHNAGLPIFCTEFSICDASGNGNYDISNANKWMSILKKFNISYACWNLSNNNESSAMFQTSCKKLNGWKNSDLTTTGAWFINTTRPLYKAELEKYSKNNSNNNNTVAKKTAKVAYKGYVQGKGWTGTKYNGKVSGTKKKRLEAIKISLKNVPKTTSGGIRYNTYVQGKGWQKSQKKHSTWFKNGKKAGITGKGKRMEATCIELYGDVAKQYDVYYRVYVKGYGWLAWAKNGQIAGTKGKKKQIESMQVVLVKKGEKAPGKKYAGVTSTKKKAYIH